MNIPNDTGHPYRLNKFVEYQHRVPPINPITVCEFARRHSFDPDDCVSLAWLVSCTYCDVTSIFLSQALDWRKETPDSVAAFWMHRKPELLFGSARKYAKNLDWFPILVNKFIELTQRQPHAWLLKQGDYAQVGKAVGAVPFTGRFSIDLFLEMLVHLGQRGMIGVQLAEPEALDWKNCANLTSGMFNIFYRDEEADDFDKHGKVSPEQVEFLEAKVREVKSAIEAAYPGQAARIPVFVPKICSFRNLFKATRYGGFHHDRQLEQLRHYQAVLPGSDTLWNEIYEIRKDLFSPALLGELGGWTGIRKERKKLWTTQGLTGVEDPTYERNRISETSKRIEPKPAQPANNHTDGRVNSESPRSPEPRPQEPAVAPEGRLDQPASNVGAVGLPPRDPNMKAKIVNIRGTSGSGKSHLIRQVMERFPNKQPVLVPGRKQPLYYEFSGNGGTPLSILGHYECACGGCDTISTGTDGIFQLVRDRAAVGNVLFEGLLIGVEVTRTAKLVDAGEVHVIQLDTPVEKCVESINMRRQARGKLEPVNPKNTESKHKGVAQTMKRLKNEAPGVITWTLSREAALAKVLELLGV
jgi:hypothetical protein